MTEDTKNQKPKATLIKHKKEDVQSRPEKKRVVVRVKTIRANTSQDSNPGLPKEKSGQSPRDSGGGGEKNNDNQNVNKHPEGKPEKPADQGLSRDVNKDKKSTATGAPVTPPQLDSKTREKPQEHKSQSTSFQRIDTGKDTVASPPGVQVYEHKREGGKAGVVAGRQVDGGPRKPMGKRPSGQQQGRAGAYRQGSFPRNGSSSRPQRGDNRFAGRPPAGKPGTGNRLTSGRPGGFRRPGPPSSGAPRIGAPRAPSPPPAAARGKKFYKAKKTYEKHREQKEKLYQYSKKKQVVQTNPVPKKIDIMEAITVAALARKMNLKAAELISKLMGMGMMVSMNQQIDAETAAILADDYGCKVNIVSLFDETLIESDHDEGGETKRRPPIVTVMGHIDHGKTKLLDAIRGSDVIEGEHGGITQHIGAYMVHLGNGGCITFLDTPGHSAFTQMRARGAKVTDLVVLVVAADDGVMPRTVEAIEHAKAAGSPIIVAINKMDLPEANPDRVRQQLSEYGLMPEGWGGSTQFVEISALKNEGIKELLDIIILESEMLELETNWDCRSAGTIIEARVDKGRGIVATVLVEKGILSIGDTFVAGIYHGKVRAMFNEHAESLKQATPSTPVEILGFSGGVPDAGDPFQTTESERDARQYGAKRQELKKMENPQNVKKITLDNLYDSIKGREYKEFKVIIKGDVHGSVEALKIALEKLGNEEVNLVCIRAAAGAIVEDDVNLAAASDAIIIGFHVHPTPRAALVADRENVEIRKYNVIFEVVDDITKAMEGMLAPDFEETSIGRAEVREIFKVPKIGTIAGCMITSGIIKRKSLVHILRDDAVIHTGVLASLKRFKEDVKEVREGYECGIGLEQFPDLQVGDVLDVFENREVVRKLKEMDSRE